MKRVLIITRDFSPYCQPTGWMVRAVSLSNYLSDQGFKVTVMATRRSRKLNELPVNDDVDTIWVKNMVQYYKSHHNPILRLFAVYPFFLLTLYKFLGRPVYDDDFVAVNQYKRQLKELLSHQSFDQIIFTTPPHSLLLLIPWIRKEVPDAVLISDIRDAWSFRPMYQGNQKHMNSIVRIEKEVFNLVDSCVFVSEGMAELYKEKYHLANTAVVENGYTDIPTGTPNAEFTQSLAELKNEGFITLGYFGSGSVGIPEGHKDLTRLFDAIESEDKLLEKLAIVVQGKINGYDSFDSPVKHLIFPPTDLNQVYSHIKMVDFGLTVFTDPPYYAPAVVTAKTYEYIYCNKPIIGLADKNATSLRKIMKETGGYFANINDQYEVVALLFRVLEDVENGSAFKNSKLTENREKFSRVYQYKKYLDLLQSK